MYYKCSVVSFVIYVMWRDSWKWGTSWSWSYGSWIYNYTKCTCAISAYHH